MKTQPIPVRVVPDEIGNHLPVWFPSPIFDDETKMPVSATLRESLRKWNQAGEDRGSFSLRQLDNFYDEGLRLSRLLAQELGSTYQVRIHVGGSNPRWIAFEPPLNE